MEEINQDIIRLTEFSHGAGCGCKISPGILNKILKSTDASSIPTFPGLLVGNDTRDDAAVMDIGNGQALVSTTDFFMPIVDDPFDFGRIASVNAISDVYAMGAKPIMAIAILGWPISKLSPEIAARVLEGARKICLEAGIPLAGGHSIDSPEPIFGLSVNGIAPLENIKKNNTAKAGSSLYLTKKVGVGILSTAQKKGILEEADLKQVVDSMTTLNRLGEKLGGIHYIEAMTDVTGFGLLGHLLEICEGSKVHAEIYFDQVPKMENVLQYLSMNCIPGGTHRNWDSYGQEIGPINETQKMILADPQTSGGLLIAVQEHHEDEFRQLLKEINFPELISIGKLIPENNGPRITVS